MLAHISLPVATRPADSLQASLRALLPDVALSVRPTDPGPPVRANGLQHGVVRTSLWSVSVEATDQKGIVKEVSGRFENVAANVCQMTTETWVGSGGDGGKRFRLCCTVSVEDARFRGLPIALREVERQFGATISISYAGIPP